jgi:muramoyltetrapeptide carboxypeptidase
VRAVAPSGCFDRDTFLAGVALVERAGFRVSYNDSIFARRLYLAGDDARRAGELEQALRDPSVHAIWTARGGYGAARFIARVDPELVRASSPWLVGFSDATALHALWARAGLASVHGANLTTLTSWSESARSELLALLRAPQAVTYSGSVLRHGPCVRGWLVGGNLTVLASLVGTPALPPLHGCVLLVEDVGERPYRLDRALTQLRNAGALEGVAGIAIGQLSRCEEPSPRGFEPLDAVSEALSGLNVPVLSGLPFGHEPSARAVLLGGDADIDCERCALTVTPPERERADGARAPLAAVRGGQPR